MEYSYCGGYSDCRSILQDYLDIKFSTDKRLQNQVIGALMQKKKKSDSYQIELADCIVFGGTPVIVRDQVDNEISDVMILTRESSRIEYHSLDKMQPVLA